MRVVFESLLDGAERAHGLVVIIDVFRAFSTACYILEQVPAEYLLVGESRAACRLLTTAEAPFLVGKTELGETLSYDIPNSPTRACQHQLAGRTLIHRTGAGARGILRASRAEEILAGSLVNAEATAAYIRDRGPEVLTLVSMGHEGDTPSEEDELCARYLKALLQGVPLNIAGHREELRRGAGRYFFDGATQEEYPREDFDRCLALNRFPFALRATRHGDYARLERCAP